MHDPVALNDDSERLLGSAGEDGAISIWNARSSETKSRSSMTMGSGVVALAFTPDGAFIAGATSERILVWKVGDVHIPRASWIRAPQPGWQTPQSHDSLVEEDQHCLSWDASGQKLAYGVLGLVCLFTSVRLYILTLSACNYRLSTVKNILVFCYNHRDECRKREKTRTAARRKDLMSLLFLSVTEASRGRMPYK